MTERGTGNTEKKTMEVEGVDFALQHTVAFLFDPKMAIFCGHSRRLLVVAQKLSELLMGIGFSWSNHFRVYQPDTALLILQGVLTPRG